MNTRQAMRWQPSDSVLLAQMSCLFLGLGMIVWGLAPAFIERAITKHAPPILDLLVGSVVVLMGFAFIGLHVLVGRRNRRGVWIAFLVSATLAAIGLALTILAGLHVGSSFLILFSGWTCFATWLALATVTRDT